MLSAAVKNLASSRWSGRETDLLVELWEDGNDASAITEYLNAKGINRTRYAVQQRACRLGLTKRPTGLVKGQSQQRPFTPQEDETIRQFWHVLIIEEIAASIGRSGRNGTRLTRKHGIEGLGLPPYKAGSNYTFISAATAKRIEKMRDRGKNWNEIAEAVGHSPDLLSRRFKKDKLHLEDVEFSDKAKFPVSSPSIIVEPSNRPHPRLARPIFFDNEPDIVNKMVTGRPNGR